MEAPILRWSQRSFKNHSLVSENGCLGMHSGIRVLSYIACLRRSFPLVFHAARSLSGSLRSPPSPRGEGFVSGIAVSPSNLRPFGAPPSIGRRECPHEPLPLEGAAERSEAGLASFFAAKPRALSLPPWGRETASAVDRVLSLMAHLRRSPLSFIPLVPYPARSARHLPHAGKALFRKYRYPHPTSAPSGHLLPEEGGRMPHPYSKFFSRIVIPKSPSVLWYNMTRRMTRS